MPKDSKHLSRHQINEVGAYACSRKNDRFLGTGRQQHGRSLTDCCSRLCFVQYKNILMEWEPLHEAQASLSRW